MGGHHHMAAASVFQQHPPLHGFFSSLLPPFTPGNNMLLVGVYGPEFPCHEVLVKHEGNLKYCVTYQLKEHGNYILMVKWGEDHIPGSPFHVTVP